MKLTFFGATEGVTGSNFHIETKSGVKFIVDCGLFQGDNQTEGNNWKEFQYNPSELDFALVTHSHIDHIGRLPKLCKDGFKGFIYSTEPVAGFAEIFLQDTRKILKNEAEKKGKPELFSDQDVTNAVSRFKTQKYREVFEPAPGVRITLYDAGHILGSAFILVEADGKKVVFSGDLGNPPVPILEDTEELPKTDYVVMESTYGDRLHKKDTERKTELERIIEEAVTKNGVLLMPSFAMERTQEILYELNELLTTNRIKSIPIYIDSPLAIRATEIYVKYPNYFDKEARDILSKGNDFFDFSGLTVIESMEQSKELDREVGPKIIIAGSGMSTGGRILFHEKRFLPEPSTTLAIVGFQVEGTLGRLLKDGAKKVKIMGEDVEVQAKIHEIGSYSAHADQKMLSDWATTSKNGLKEIFLVHGEQSAKEALKSKIQDESGVKTIIPAPSESFDL
jgi:metallo-beta-lactamase family protein